MGIRYLLSDLFTFLYDEITSYHVFKSSPSQSSVQVQLTLFGEVP